MLPVPCAPRPGTILPLLAHDPHFSCHCLLVHLLFLPACMKQYGNGQKNRYLGVGPELDAHMDGLDNLRRRRQCNVHPTASGGSKGLLISEATTLPPRSSALRYVLFTKIKPLIVDRLLPGFMAAFASRSECCDGKGVLSIPLTLPLSLLLSLARSLALPPSLPQRGREKRGGAGRRKQGEGGREGGRKEGKRRV
jgi:hypothetical protein